LKICKVLTGFSNIQNKIITFFRGISSLLVFP
jgi:hypothetical protein